MKRLISCSASDYKNMTREDFKQSIVSSEGRTIMGETVVTAAPLLEGVTNAEVMAAFGVDLIVLNEFDVFEKKIEGFYDCENPIEELKKLTGRPVGINLEPVDETAVVLDDKVVISEGRKVHRESVIAAENLKVDFITITGNPSTGVSNESIKNSIEMVRGNFSGLIFAGKMHGAGVSEEVVNTPELKEYIRLGADGILIPTVGTVPGLSEEKASEAVREVKKLGGLVINAMGTSQESADEDTIREFGLSNKRVGGDIHHIGDGGYGRMPIPENIMKLSVTVRGKRHAYFRMSQSIHR
ncbi:haloacid dehalogenase-like hydrolase [Enterococcus sp. 669A]|uniref:Haloacid dehalogenase-like hydrolase n=1 Tax=Candidatus Enterococcus moelleringii TaxID=2815325 RepID=A0ABS3LJN8_9ENTE|nr:haloacid dehalogenase-like hydrolase [Enterococcus sp. 669A]MBO1308569.1 haloacid dehalogenase-like hydrolase [Enterococcus sp. 669A]